PTDDAGAPEGTSACPRPGSRCWANPGRPPRDAGSPRPPGPPCAASADTGWPCPPRPAPRPAPSSAARSRSRPAGPPPRRGWPRPPRGPAGGPGGTGLSRPRDGPHLPRLSPSRQPRETASERPDTATYNTRTLTFSKELIPPRSRHCSLAITNRVTSRNAATTTPRITLSCLDLNAAPELISL